MKLTLLFLCLLVFSSSLSGCAIHTPRTILKNDLILKDTLRQIASVMRDDGTDLTFSGRSGIYSGQRKEITGISEHGGSIVVPVSSIVSCDASPASGILTIAAYFFGIVALGFLVLFLTSGSATPPITW